MTIYVLLFDSYGLVFVGRPLWREDGSVFYICCWSMTAHSFSGPSPLGLATVFYCLRFETSRFVTSYDSQGHGGGIRPHDLGFLLYSVRTDLCKHFRCLSIDILYCWLRICCSFFFLSSW
jgi:hypothetical protein